jgi:hypothetical protein
MVARDIGISNKLDPDTRSVVVHDAANESSDQDVLAQRRLDFGF